VEHCERPSFLVFLKALVITTAIGLAAAYLLTSSIVLHLGLDAARSALAGVASTTQPEELSPGDPEETPSQVVLARRAE
jgi:uncharacterized membrane protein